MPTEITTRKRTESMESLMQLNYNRFVLKCMHALGITFSHLFNLWRVSSLFAYFLVLREDICDGTFVLLQTIDDIKNV